MNIYGGMDRVASDLEVWRDEDGRVHQGRGWGRGWRGLRSLHNLNILVGRLGLRGGTGGHAG